MEIAKNIEIYIEENEKKGLDYIEQEVKNLILNLNDFSGVWNSFPPSQARPSVKLNR